MERRDFLKSVSIGTGLAAAAPNLLPVRNAEARAEDTPDKKVGPEETVRGEMRYRTLGRTGERVSLIGLGGFHIGVQPDVQESFKIIRTAIDRGITFLDNSWDYHMGGSEERMGKALRDGYRDKVFLMTKIDGRTAAEANKQLDDCLRRLQTDHIDLVQHHEVIRMEDPDRIFAQNGANDALLAAKKAGKIRYIGFTGQGPARSSADAADGRKARLPLRHRADADQRDGRPLPQLQPQCGARRHRTRHRRARHETDGQRPDPHQQN